MTGVPNRLNLLTDFEAAYGAQLIGSTIVRIRGVFSCEVATAIGGPSQQIRAAALVEPNPGSAAVAADGPWAGQFNDWMLFEPFICYGGAVDAGMAAQRVIDVRSARKIEEINETLMMYLAAPTAIVNTLAVNVTYDLSIGIKLP